MLPYTLADLCMVVISDYLPSKARNTAYNRTLLYTRLCAEWGQLPLTALTTDWCRQWRDTLRRQGHKPGTVRTYMASLAVALDVAVHDLEWLPSHPLRKVAKPPEPPGRVRYLSDEERAALLAACQASSNPHLYAVVLLALTTGGRKRELLWLAWRQVDLTQGILRLQHTKNGQGRAVPVPALAVAVLTRQPRGSVWVFPRADGRWPIDIEWGWTRARRRAGLEDFHFHDLRHTAASYLAMSGASLREIAEILGHKNLKATMKYAHLTLPHTRGVVERMAQAFLQE